MDPDPDQPPVIWDEIKAQAESWDELAESTETWNDLTKEND